MARRLVYDWLHGLDNTLFGNNEVRGDEIRGGDGDDKLFGLDGDDLLLGGNGKDLLHGGAGNDEVRGNDDGDTVLIDPGDNIYNGGDGFDTFSFDFVVIVEGGFGGFGYSILPSTIGFSVDLESGETRSSTLNSDAFSEVWGTNSWAAFEFYTMTGRDDVFRGDNTSDSISTFGGDDLIEGRGGGDNLMGGQGIDTLSYESSPEGVVASLDRRDQFGGDAEGDQTFDFENLRGSSFADVLSGDENDNRIEGRAGADEINGGGGRDILRGGAERDAFIFEEASDSTGNFNQRDVIEDFLRTDPYARTVFSYIGVRGILGDTIDLHAIDADQRSGRVGNQDFDFIGDDAFTGAGQVRVVQAQDAEGRNFTLVQAEVNGDGVADFALTVFTTNDTLLGASDFSF